MRGTVRPVTPAALVAELVELVDATGRRQSAHRRQLTDHRQPADHRQPTGRRQPAGRVRVAIDGPPAAAPDQLVEQLVGPLRALGRPVGRVRAEDFLRPASVRLEYGRTDPDAYYDGWVDVAGLRREVLDPLGPGGAGDYLPTLWDATTDRATRAGYRRLPAGGVLLLSGALLLGGPLAFDLSVHLWLSPAALARRTPAEQAWTLPAFERYRREVDPAAVADVVVRLDDPRRPAIVRG